MKSKNLQTATFVSVDFSIAKHAYIHLGLGTRPPQFIEYADICLSKLHVDTRSIEFTCTANYITSTLCYDVRRVTHYIVHILLCTTSTDLKFSIRSIDGAVALSSVLVLMELRGLFK